MTTEEIIEALIKASQENPSLKYLLLMAAGRLEALK